jgi:hypothetical protein
MIVKQIVYLLVDGQVPRPAYDGMGGVAASSRQGGELHKLYRPFSDFKSFGHTSYDDVGIRSPGTLLKSQSPLG